MGTFRLDCHAASAVPIGVHGGAWTNGQISSAMHIGSTARRYADVGRSRKAPPCGRERGPTPGRLALVQVISEGGFMPAVTMQELEFEHAGLLPGRKTLVLVSQSFGGRPRGSPPRGGRL